MEKKFKVTVGLMFWVFLIVGSFIYTTSPAFSYAFFAIALGLSVVFFIRMFKTIRKNKEEKN